MAAAEAATAAARAADRVELVDEDDRGRLLLGLLEEVAHARRADADDHLDELRRAQREERHVGLAGDRPREQRLARARRAGQQHALRDRCAEPSIAIGVLEEVDDLLELLLDLVDAGDVGERHARLRGVVALGLRAPEAHHAAAARARGTAQDVDQQRDDQQRRAERDQDRGEDRAPLDDRARVDLDVLLDQQLEQLVVLRERGLHGLEALLGTLLLELHGLLELALDRVRAPVDLLDVAGLDLLAEERIWHLQALVLVGRDQLAEDDVQRQQAEQKPPQAPAAGKPRHPAARALRPVRLVGILTLALDLPGRLLGRCFTALQRLGSRHISV